MKCRKKESRTLLSLLENYKCEGCIYYLENEIIKIGYHTLYLYYPYKCKIEKISCNEIFFNVKLASFLLDYIRKKEDDLLIWISEEKLEDYFVILEDLLDYFDIHIIKC